MTGIPTLRQSRRRRCREAVGGQLAAVDPDVLAEALPVLRAPLGFGSMADVAPRTDWRAALRAALAGGDDLAAGVTLRDTASLLRRELPYDDVLAPLMAPNCWLQSEGPAFAQGIT